jgi:N6-adenosine-specific RNA methylase IME4
MSDEAASHPDSGNSSAAMQDTLAGLQALADTGFRAGVSYVDLPLHFRTYSAKGRGRCADRHYRTMSQVELLAMVPLVRALAARNCALFSWASGTHDEDSREIILGWEFRLINFAFVWVKTRKGCTVTDPDELTELDAPYITGKTTRANCEMVRLAKIGSPPRLNNDVRQLVIAPRGRHSEKPEEVAHRIERLYPGPYLELFARRERPNWLVWGDEVRAPLLQLADQRERV